MNSKQQIKGKTWPCGTNQSRLPLVVNVTLNLSNVVVLLLMRRDSYWNNSQMLHLKKATETVSNFFTITLTLRRKK